MNKTMTPKKEKFSRHCKQHSRNAYPYQWSTAPAEKKISSTRKTKNLLHPFRGSTWSYQPRRKSAPSIDFSSCILEFIFNIFDLFFIKIISSFYNTITQQRIIQLISKLNCTYIKMCFTIFNHKICYFFVVYDNFSY